MAEKHPGTNETPATDVKKGEQSEQDAHPICRDAPMPEKCEEFVDRLQEAHDNIDPSKR